VFFSPLSIAAALGMTYAGARSETAAQMSDVLGVSIPDADWHAAFGDLVDDLNGDKARGYRLQVANRLFGQAGYPFEPPFLDTCADDWKAPLEEVDWQGDPEGSRGVVNEWVADQTEDRIPTLLPPGAVDGDTRLVLANAIYFLADWWTRFDPEDTGPASFARLDGSTVTVDMMRIQTGELDEHRIRTTASSDELAVIARLPYEDDEVSAYLVVPTADDGLPEVEAKLGSGWFDDAIAPLGGAGVDAGSEATIGLPSFELRWKASLVEPLQRLGMVDAFAFGVCDLTGIADPDDELPLRLKDVIHEAWVMVDESGTEAAAATAAIAGTDSVSLAEYVVADHPFLLIVRDDLTGSLLFVARITDPTVGE